jgi:hypothetical protein
MVDSEPEPALAASLVAIETKLSACRNPFEKPNKNNARLAARVTGSLPA